MKTHTWDEVLTMADQLAKPIGGAGLGIDIIVAVARGGLVPARLLSGRLGIPRMASIGIEQRDGEAFIYSIPGGVGYGNRVLLVEDALKTGRTLAMAEVVLGVRGAEVWTAAFCYEPDPVIVPTYSLGQVDAIPRFPWE